ncbi:MAG: hypothetical protein HDKAJFGB_01792 [Anaerolineae bacterium]|nr:hypothetical protein [Anaerolineae bacterium]
MNVQRRTRAAIQFYAAFDFRLLRGARALRRAGGQMQFRDERVVPKYGAVLGKRANREFRIKGRADFARDKNIERRLERARDFGGDDDAAARNAQHKRVRAIFRGEQFGGEPLPRVAAIGKLNHDAPTAALFVGAFADGASGALGRAHCGVSARHMATRK